MMKNFSQVYNDKLNEAKTIERHKKLEDKKEILNLLIKEGYDESYLPKYWNLQEGLTAKGIKALNNNTINKLDEDSSSAEIIRFIKSEVNKKIDEMTESYLKNKNALYECFQSYIYDKTGKQIRKSSLEKYIEPLVFSHIKNQK